MANCRHDKCEYAIKFFLSRSAFNAELAIYHCADGPQTSGLAHFLPQVGDLLL
jgi:hypothetical protein